MLAYKYSALLDKSYPATPPRFYNVCSLNKCSFMEKKCRCITLCKNKYVYHKLSNSLYNSTLKSYYYKCIQLIDFLINRSKISAVNCMFFQYNGERKLNRVIDLTYYKVPIGTWKITFSGINTIQEPISVYIKTKRCNNTNQFISLYGTDTDMVCFLDLLDKNY